MNTNTDKANAGVKARPLATTLEGRITSNTDMPDPLFNHTPNALKFSDDGQHHQIESALDQHILARRRP
jgi:hypothetical protein